MRTPEEFARDYFGAARTTTDERAIAARDAEWMPKVETVEKELKTMTYMWRALVENAPKLHGEIKRLRAEVEAARARLGEAERLLREAPPHGGMTAYRDWLAMRDAYVACVSATADSPVPATIQVSHESSDDRPARAGGITDQGKFATPAGATSSDDVPCPPRRPEVREPALSTAPSNSFLAPVLARLDALELAAREDAKAWADSMLKLFTKVTALERVVKRIDTEHAEMCPQHTGLAAPPAPVAIPMLPPRRAHVYIDPEDEDEPEPVSEAPMCYQIDCRYYGQRHATAHEPREPGVAGPVHAFVAGVGSVCWHYHPPKDGSAGLFCHAPPGNPIHATGRK